MRIPRPRTLLLAAVVTLVLGSLATAFWVHKFKSYTPVEVMQDIRAGIAARNAPNPVERFLELRYGPLCDPANRQKAFLDFFNVGHIEGLEILVDKMGPERRKKHIPAMAEWIASYRASMSQEEKASLNARLQADSGRAVLRQATARYLQQDVRYRAQTAPVITELMTTIAAVREP